MVITYINNWTLQKAGGIPCVNTRFSLSVEYWRADAGRDGMAKSVARD